MSSASIGFLRGFLGVRPCFGERSPFPVFASFLAEEGGDGHAVTLSWGGLGFEEAAAGCRSFLGHDCSLLEHDDVLICLRIAFGCWLDPKALNPKP